MAKRPNVRALYWTLTGLLIAGLIAAAITLAVVKPGPGGINVAGATAGVAVGTIAIGTVLMACLRFMHRITLVIAASGGPITSARYQSLMQILGGGLALALLLAVFARPDMSSTTIARILVATGVGLIVLALILTAFLWFLRTLVTQSSMPNAPSVASLYGYLIAFGMAGLIGGAIILTTVEPGTGPIHVAGSALGLGLAVAALAGVTLALLIYLAATVADAIAVQENPAKGRSLHADRDAGMASDPGVVYDTTAAPPGSGRNVVDVEGIGPTYAARLEEACGIIDFAQLRMADPSTTATKVGTTTENVRSWQQMIHLMDIKGVGPQYAELLVMAGIRTPDQLATADARELKQTIDAIELRRKKSRVLKVNVEEGLVNRLIGFAQAHVAKQ